MRDAAGEIGVLGSEDQRREESGLEHHSPLPAGVTVHAVGHFHLDPVWLWDKSDGMERFRATVRSLLMLMERNPEMTVAASSAAMYAYLRDVDRELFEKIVQRVHEGRWEPVGGMWVEPDEHVPGGESYVRQLLLGQEFFAHYLGRPARVAWSPDSFGRYGNLPRMLAGSGLDYFVFKRPERHQKALPDLFWWTGTDGSKLLTLHIREYGTWGNSLMRALDGVVRDLGSATRHGMLLYGVGNHGGGPTQANLDALRERQRNSHGPAIRFSTPEEYFAAVVAAGDELPVWSGDLDRFVAGGYSSHIELKRSFRAVEAALLTADAASSLSEAIAGRAAQHDEMTRAWRRLAFNHFHDIAAGTSMAEAHEAVFDELGEARAIARDVTIGATHSIANRVEIPACENGQALVVFNPNGHATRQFVVTNVPALELPTLQGDWAETHRLLGEDGCEIPAQGIFVSSLPFHRLGFTVELPPLSYRVLRLVPRDEAPVPAEGGSLFTGETVLENDAFRLTIDPVSGTIASLLNREHGLEVFSGAAASPVLVHDDENAWGGSSYTREVPDLRFRPTSVRSTHDGPLMAAIAVESVLERDGQFTGSTLWQEFRLYRDVRSVDVRVRLLWRERRVALKLAFPLFVKMYPEATVEIPFGTAMVPTDGVEAPGLAWADAAGETDFTERGEKHWHGVTVANTASYSYSFRHHFPTRALTLAMMVARGNPYTEASPHGTTLPTPGYDLQDEGLHELSYSIVPHLEGWREAGSHRRAAELTRPLIVLPESVHLGDLPARASIFSCSHGSIELGAIKAADDGDGLIVRLYEAYGAATRGVAITCAGRQWTADFRAGEVKTFRLPSDGGAAAAVDLLEATRLS